MVVACKHKHVNTKNTATTMIVAIILLRMGPLMRRVAHDYKILAKGTLNSLSHAHSRVPRRGERFFEQI